jgi:myo-inositol catabolism protein IolS
MQYKTLGKSDMRVSVIALGCWQFAGGQMWGEQEDKASIETVHAAIDSGINLLDTAEGYGDGKSEEVVGKALAGKRDKVFIATKASGPTFAPDELRNACEKSLERLDTDYIDLYQLHWPRPDTMVPAAEILETVRRLQEEGKIRQFGVCNFGPGDMEGFLPNNEIVSNQMNYSLLWRGIEYGVVPLCEKEGIGILTYSTLVHGLLSGRYDSLDAFPAGRARSRHFSGEREHVRHGEPGHEELTSRTLSRISELCGEYGVSMVDAAYGWALHQPGVTSVLAGSRTVAQIEQNAAVADIEFPDSFLGALTEATDELKEIFGNALDMWQSPGRIRL